MNTHLFPASYSRIFGQTAKRCLPGMPSAQLDQSPAERETNS